MLPDDAPDTQSNFICSSSNAFNAPMCAAAFIHPPDNAKPLIIPPLYNFMID